MTKTIRKAFVFEGVCMLSLLVKVLVPLKQTVTQKRYSPPKVSSFWDAYHNGTDYFLLFHIFTYYRRYRIDQFLSGDILSRDYRLLSVYLHTNITAGENDPYYIGFIPCYPTVFSAKRSFI